MPTRAPLPPQWATPCTHWTHLELQRYFGVYQPLNEDTAPAIWAQANRVPWAALARER